MRDFVYPVVMPTAEVLFKALDFRFDISGIEHIPTEGGALLAINHLSFVDYVMAGYPGKLRGRYTRFIAKKEVFDHPIGGPVMRSFHHLPIDRSAGREGIEAAVRYLRDGELVGIFPEATISRSFLIKELKTGAARIAGDAQVPLIPVVLWGTQRLMTKGQKRDFGRHKSIAVRVGEPLHPDGADPTADTVVLKERMEAMLDDAIRSYPAEEQPPGSWWLPQAYGGSAPTLEEAEQMYADERRQRAQRRAAKRKAAR
jgi:1-acyl-sn-glycerol-3-phosphate acyltransferase